VLAGVLVAALLPLTGLPAAAEVHHRHPDRPLINTAQVNNHRDDRSRTRLAFDVEQTHADAVTARNTASAYAQCTGCRTVAVAFQIVLAGGSPTTLDVGNLSQAVNDEGCTRCQTTALAYQFVVAADGRIGLTWRGRWQLYEVDVALARLLRGARWHPEQANDELEQQVADLAQRVNDILQAEVRTGREVGRGCGLTTRYTREHPDRGHAALRTAMTHEPLTHCGDR
jgi:putative peptide zinc metalloprotease protein